MPAGAETTSADVLYSPITDDNIAYRNKLTIRAKLNIKILFSKYRITAIIIPEHNLFSGFIHLFKKSLIILKYLPRKNYSFSLFSSKKIHGKFPINMPCIPYNARPTPDKTQGNTGKSFPCGSTGAHSYQKSRNRDNMFPESRPLLQRPSKVRRLQQKKRQKHVAIF